MWFNHALECDNCFNVTWYAKLRTIWSYNLHMFKSLQWGWSSFYSFQLVVPIHCIYKAIYIDPSPYPGRGRAKRCMCTPLFKDLTQMSKSHPKIFKLIEQ